MTRDCVDLFLHQAFLQPGAPAVKTDRALTSYGALEQAVRRIAGLVAQHDQPRVLIALPQGADAYAAMLGVILGGGCYAPVNVAAPPAKIRRIARLFQPDLIIAGEGEGEDLLAEAPQARLLHPQSFDGLAPLQERGRRHDIAYVIFTSGSTGLPKGVTISRAAFDHYIAWLVGAFGITPADIVAQHPNIAFDVSVMGIFGALCAGAAVCPIVSPGDRLMPDRAIARQGVTVWISVPSVVALMMRGGRIAGENLKTVRLFAFCGEALLPEQTRALFAARPDARVVNTYGPTEATVSMTQIWLDATNFRDACDRSVSIGSPIPGMGLHLVGGPDEDEGELVITGPQLADGYWNDPEQSARVFRDIDIHGDRIRAYYSGDWAQRIGGRIYFRNRMDFQVKINGYRLELDEVAAAIREIGWERACALLWRGQIVAVLETEAAPPLAPFRKALAERLEAHAVPSEIFAIPQLPRNENDKIDPAAVLRWLDESTSVSP